MGNDCSDNALPGSGSSRTDIPAFVFVHILRGLAVFRISVLFVCDPVDHRVW